MSQDSRGPQPLRPAKKEAAPEAVSAQKSAQASAPADGDPSSDLAVKSVKIPQALDDCHRMYVWMVGKLNKFPRERRHVLAARIEGYLLDVLESLRKAAFTSPAEKLRHLEAANLQIDLLQHLWRAAYDVGAIEAKGHRHASKLLDDIGLQIGRWRKFLVQRSR